MLDHLKKDEIVDLACELIRQPSCRQVIGVLKGDGTVMPPVGVGPFADVVQILRENHRAVTGEYPKRIGAVIPRKG